MHTVLSYIVFKCIVLKKPAELIYDFLYQHLVVVPRRLGCNKLGDEGAELVGEALKRNSSKSVKHVL